jgi:hypothetical protein
VLEIFFITVIESPTFAVCDFRCAKFSQLFLVMIIRSCLKSFPTEKCRAGRVRVAGRGPLQPCRNGAVARRGRKKRRLAGVAGLRDANAKAGFSVGNNLGAGNDLGADARKTFGAEAVRGAARKGIAAHAARSRQVPGADAAVTPPKGRGAPKGDGVEYEPGERMGALLQGGLRVLFSQRRVPNCARGFGVW